MAITYEEMLDTFAALKKTEAYLEEKWEGIEGFLRGNSRFAFIGCGSSFCIAKSMATICAMSTGLPSAILAAGDVMLHAERYKKIVDGAAVVVVSRSGHTSELILALDALKEQGCRMKVASAVCADDAPLVGKSDFVLSTPWAFDQSVCQTRCVTNFYYITAYIAARITGNQAAMEDLRHLLAEGGEYLAQAEQIAKDIAPQPWTHVIVLADAELEGIAEEGALVFKEVCQLPSNDFHMLDIRHGPMVLVGKETLALVALGPSNEQEWSLVRDLKEKGAHVVAFPGDPGRPEAVAFAGVGRPLSHMAKGIPFIILCQMVAYYKSKETGTDPDKPTGLHAWITL